MSDADPLLRTATAVALAAGPPLPNVAPPPQQQPADTEPEYDGICGCCRWFIAGPYCVKKRLVFAGWIIVGILSPIFYIIYISDSDQGLTINYGYILCCTLAICMAFYATFNFRDVIELRNACNSLVESTKALATQRDKIRNEVEKLQTAHVKLEAIEEELATSNTALRKNFKNFEKWNETIKRETANNVQNAQTINKDFRAAIAQYQKMLVQNEKAILDKAYKHIEGRDGQKGLSKDEFSDLLYSLPARYKLRFEKLGKTFEDFAGDDGIIDYSEFKVFMGLMAEEEANCDVQIPEAGIGAKNKKRGKRRRDVVEEDDDEDDDGKDDEKGN